MILAPYGINGMLVGHVSRDIDMHMLRENWERNYPIRHIDGLPDFIEVTAGKFQLNFWIEERCARRNLRVQK